MCVLIFSTILSETFLILRRTERDIIKNVYRSSYKVPVIVVRFDRNLNFFGIFRKKSPNITFLGNQSSEGRVVPYGRTDRQTNLTKLIVVFRNFTNALKNQSVNAV